MEDSSEEMTEEKALLILERTRYLEDSDCELPEDFWSETDEELPMCHLKQEKESGETCPTDPPFETGTAVPRVEAYPSTSATALEDQTHPCNNTVSAYPQEQPVCHQKKHEKKVGETSQTDAPFETNPAVLRVEAYPSTSAAASVDRTPACNNTVSTYPQEGYGSFLEEEPEIESPLFTNQAHFLVKEESMDSNESWVDRIKQEPTSPLSMDTPKQEPDEIENQDMDVKEECGTTVKQEPESHLSMNKAHFVVKEETMDSNESWFNGLKEDPTSPLLTDTPIEEHDEIEDNDMDVKKETFGKEEESDSAEEIVTSCSSEREDHEFIKESSQCSHFECSAWNCSSQIASSATQSLSGDMIAMNCQRRFLKSSFSSEDEILVPGSLQSQKPFAVVPCSTSSDTMNREEVAEMYFLKGHFPYKSELKSSPNHEETPYQRSALQSDSLRTSTCRASLKCNQCKKIFKRKQDLSWHIRKHTGERDFKCSQYGKSFTNRGDLTRHMLGHTGYRPFKCSQCGKAFKERGPLTRHLRIHSGDRPFKCPQCGKSFTESGNLTRHMLGHIGDRPFKCSQCGKSFTTSGNLTTHLRIHSQDRPFKCSQCEKSFTQSSHLTRHMLRHTGDRPFKCSQCGKSFTQSGTLTAHLRIHSRDRPFKCSQCGKSFTKSGTLTAHLRIHSRDRPFKCSQCGKSFTQSGTLTAHLRIHSGERPFKCSQCGKSFTKSGTLTAHLRIHSRDRPFKCSQCGKSFTTSGNLTAHLRIHSGERPFKCSQCGKSFTLSTHLTTHLRIHSRDRPFKCSQCGKSFIQSSHLTGHMLRHTGERPFKCSQCGKSFTLSSHLTTHLRIHS